MSTPAIPTEFRNALPDGVDVDACTVTTYSELCAGHIAWPTESLASPSDDEPVILLPGWRADDGNAVVDYPGEESSRSAAQAYVNEGEWGVSNKTSWVRVSAWRVAYAWDAADQELIELQVDDASHVIAIDPDEPGCVNDDAHSWSSPHELLGGLRENPGVWGNGGGVIIKEVCAHCGIYRVTDTWAQEPSTGQQGLESVDFREADDSSLGWIQARIAARFVSLVDEHGSEAAEAAICDIQCADSAEVSADGEVSVDDLWVCEDELPELADALEKRLGQECEVVS